MRLIYLYFLLVPALCWAQGKPLRNAVSVTKKTNKLAGFPNLFTQTGVTSALANAQDTKKAISNLQLNTNVLNSIRVAKPTVLAISLPTAEGLLELELIPANIFAPGFAVKTSTPDTSFSFDPANILFYQGVVKNDAKSLVTIAFFSDKIMGLIADSTGNRILAPRQDKSATDYTVYNERAVTTQSYPFSCGTPDELPASTPPKQSTENATSATANSTCVKYVGIYFEADYALYQLYSGNSDLLVNSILFLFDQVVTLFRNEGIYVQISGLKIWNSTDPYATASSTVDLINQFSAYGQSTGNSFPGQLAHLLSSRHFSDFGGYARIGGLRNNERKDAYGVSVNIQPYSANAYPTYSYCVSTVTHELGHNLGSNHTHWCGWPGGAIDNCAPTEGGCPAGPAPDNGGTIMSYCGTNTNFTKGFGPLPGNVIRTTINNTSLPITTSDNGLQSIASGSWTTASTWVCGLVPSVIYDVSVSSGNTVPLNTTGNAKSLNVNGVLNLSTSSSILNINNN